MKWRSKSTSLLPVEGQVTLPLLVTLTEMVWLTPCAHVVGTWLMSMVADQIGCGRVIGKNHHCWGDVVTVSNQN